MIINHQQNSRSRPFAAMRHRLFIAVLSSLCMISACTPSGSLYAQPKQVIEILRILPFQLEKPYKFDWRKERPDVRSGLLVVLKVDTSMVRPTNDLQPVLYAGNQTIQRINQGYESGVVIGIIPAQIDLSKEPIWFGTPALPERIEAKTIRAERTKALRSGIKPMSPDDVKNRTIPPAEVPDLTTLLRRYAADMILEFSPQEKYLAERWRLPETGK
jgi:hypothetical protein